MEALVAFALALGVFFLVRAFTTDRQAPVSAWRDRTFGIERAPVQQRSGGAVLRSRTTLERIAKALPRLDGLQAPADRVVAAAGLSTKMSGLGLVGISAIFAIVGVFVALMLLAGNSLGQWEPVALIGAPVLIGATPWIVMSSRGKRRGEAIDRALPDMLDLLVVSVEAGLALEGALQRVSARGNGPLNEEIQRTLNEIALGRRRHDALVAMSDRTHVAPVRSLINAMNQAERTGMQMGPVLRSQAEQIRTRRRQHAEEKAMKAPVKMLVPLALFIFPRCSSSSSAPPPCR
jgi:tight adherence protein C